MMREENKYAGSYVDCTFGRGGHTREILKRLRSDARLFAFDVDPEAVREAKRLEAEDPRFEIIHRPFGDIAKVFDPGTINGVVIDLGVSSPQLDDAHRGFNVTYDTALDMRMNQKSGVPAREWLRQVSEEELAWVIHAYGEDDDAILSGRIAALIKARQRRHPIETTRQLADVVRQAKQFANDDARHPAKLSAQAIRVHLNQEMEQLKAALHGSMQVLADGGRLSVISFKRKEANEIRWFCREHEEPPPIFQDELSSERLAELFPLLTTNKDFCVRSVFDPVRASWAEVERNWRARSSMTHVLMKCYRQFRMAIPTSPRPMSQQMQAPCKQPQFQGADHAKAEGVAATTRQKAAEALRSATNRHLPANPQSPAPEPPKHIDRPTRQVVVEQPPPPPPPCQPPPPATPPPSSGSSAGNDTSTQKLRSDVKSIREVMVVREDPGNPTGGFLRLCRHDIIDVLYDGNFDDEEEVGWSYGRSQHDGSHGWYMDAMTVLFRANE